MEPVNIFTLYEEWNVLDKEFSDLEESYKSYVKTVDELSKVKEKCTKSIGHQRYRSGQITQALKFLRLNSDDEREKYSDLRKRIAARSQQIKDFQKDLPRPNGLYLKVILGNVNTSLSKEEEKFKYKEEYERFKLIVTSIILTLSFMNTIVYFRVMDALLLFLQVWYYCTLTIRESILIINGSRIKGWWRAHHFIATILSGIIIVWPEGYMYSVFRKQLMWYVCYLSILQFMQYYYQQGCLYRLRALGERYNMDITIEGFHSWMWRGLSFLLPFLFFGYFYNAYTLYNLSKTPKCTEWQVLVSGAIFFIMFLGNASTTTMVLHQKLREKFQLRDFIIRKLK